MIKNLIFVVYQLILDFLVEVSKPTKLAKRFTHFTIQFRSKNLTHFTNLNSLKIINNILSQHSQKLVFGWCQKKHLHCTISRRPRTAFLEHLESKCMIFLYVYSFLYVCKFLFQKRRKLLSHG